MTDSNTSYHIQQQQQHHQQQSNSGSPILHNSVHQQIILKEEPFDYIEENSSQSNFQLQQQPPPHSHTTTTTETIIHSPGGTTEKHIVHHHHHHHHHNQHQLPADIIIKQDDIDDEEIMEDIIIESTNGGSGMSIDDEYSNDNNSQHIQHHNHLQHQQVIEEHVHEHELEHQHHHTEEIIEHQEHHPHNLIISQEHSTPSSRNSSPTNWHQPKNQLEYIQQQQQQKQHVITDSSQPPSNALGMLRHENDILYITEHCIEIGRNSSTSSVHFHVAKNSFVSRKHFQVLFDLNTYEFYLNCLSKNGVFVDDIFQRRNADPLKLPKTCTFRFPSTEIRISFESYADNLTITQNTGNGGKYINSNEIVVGQSVGSGGGGKYNLKPSSTSSTATLDNTNVIYSPLKIAIPKTEQKSPYPSPTGTMSAANSCPTSPRQGFQDYHYNFNNNNNVQGQELFQTPSTSSYNDHEKPPYSYAQLIVQSISASPDKQLTLSGIYSFISKHYPYYRKEANKGWQNSIRHNLSLNRYFIKVARSQDEPGKGSFWRIDPNSESKLIDQSFKKRRQRGSQCFRPSYGMPRSAPVSPSHMGEYQDNSRENSPLRDVVLQSAPGSPGGFQNHDSHSEDVGYGSQITQSPYNSNQYNNSPYNSSSNTSTIIQSGNGSGGGGGNGSVGHTTSGGHYELKRHHQQQPQHHLHGVAGTSSNSSVISQHSDIYDEMPDYDDDEIESNSIKRPKYSTEINQ